MHGELKKRGELLGASETKLESLIRERDRMYEVGMEWRKKAEGSAETADAIRKECTAEKLRRKEAEEKVQELALKMEMVEDVKMGGTRLNISQNHGGCGDLDNDDHICSGSSTDIFGGREEGEGGPEPLLTAAVAEVGQGSMSIGVGGLRSHEGGGEKAGAIAKAAVVHGIRTNWKVSGVADYVEGIMGKEIRARWLLGVGRRMGKAASSVVMTSFKLC